MTRLIPISIYILVIIPSMRQDGIGWYFRRLELNEFEGRCVDKTHVSKASSDSLSLTLQISEGSTTASPS